MAPLFLFLASSFNVELVYVILKGITQFSYFSNKGDENDPKAKLKIEKLRFSREYGNLTIYMDHIKIKDFDKWSKMKSVKEMSQLVKDNSAEFTPNTRRKSFQDRVKKAFLAKVE